MSDRITDILEEELVALAGGTPAEREGAAPSTARERPEAVVPPQPAGPQPAPGESRDQLLLARAGPSAIATMTAFSVDTVVMSVNGGVFIVGWVDDAADRIDVVRVTGNGWRVAFDGTGLARVRRTDVEGALGSGLHYPYGFWGFVYGKHMISGQGGCTVELVLKSGAARAIKADLRVVEDPEIRGIALTYLVNSEYFGAGQVEAIASLEAVIGAQILAVNKAISRVIASRPYVERFVSPRARPRGSIVVCLYGRAEFIFLQNAAFFDTRGMEDYEIVYVSNSPELAEQLLKEARAAHLIYGVDQSVVLLTGNAGFGAANNVAVAQCSSDRVLIVNPDVFPACTDWAARHTAVVDGMPEAQSRLFGAPLFYNDGSLMHGGMYFDVDSGLSLTQAGVRRRRLVRVEHYGKGAPPGTTRYTRARPVPAVTGAFISANRVWYESLGGFTEDYVFGHYEDADLCLKSLGRGIAPWLHDIPMWHLEGKGSTRLPVHEGGSVVNRWLFSQTWLDEIDAGLIGPAPTHPALGILAEDEDAAAAEPAAPMDAPADPAAAVASGNLRRPRRPRAARGEG
jgi:GT2 family glycosyltransferase